MEESRSKRLLLERDGLLAVCTVIQSQVLLRFRAAGRYSSKPQRLVLTTWNRRVADYTQRRINPKKVALVLFFALFAAITIARASSDALLSQPLTVRWRYE